jgi:hypothetical protein
MCVDFYEKYKYHLLKTGDFNKFVKIEHVRCFLLSIPHCFAGLLCALLLF